MHGLLSLEERRELSYGLLREWWLAATQALVDEVGEERALSSLQPYFMNTGMAGAHNLQRLLGVTAEELVRREVVTLTWPLVVGGRLGGIYVADDGSRLGEFLECSSQGSSRVGCASLCGVTGDAYVRELRPGFEMVVSKSLSKGDRSCQLVGKPLGSEAEVSATEGKRVDEHALMSTLSEDVLEYLALSIIGEAWCNATRALTDLVGSDAARTLLRRHMRHSGLALGLRFERRAKERGPLGAIKAIELIQDLHQRKCEIAQAGPEVGCEVRECPFSSSSHEMCAQYEAFFQGLCEVMDPACEFSYDRTMTNGDKSCHWTMRGKGAETAEASHGQDDPAKVLGLRYARGEISEEDFEMKMANLRKHGIL